MLDSEAVAEFKETSYKLDTTLRSVKQTLRDEIEHYERELRLMGEGEFVDSLNRENTFKLELELEDEEVDDSSKEIEEVVDERRKRAQMMLFKFEGFVKSTKEKLSILVEEMEREDNTSRLSNVEKMLTNLNVAEDFRRHNETAALNQSRNTPIKPAIKIAHTDIEEEEAYDNTVEDEIMYNRSNILETSLKESDLLMSTTEIMQHILTSTPRSNPSNTYLTDTIFSSKEQCRKC